MADLVGGIVRRQVWRAVQRGTAERVRRCSLNALTATEVRIVTAPATASLEVRIAAFAPTASLEVGIAAARASDSPLKFSNQGRIQSSKAAGDVAGIEIRRKKVAAIPLIE